MALGLLFDPAAGRAALQAGVGAEIDLALGTAVPTFTGLPSDPPVRGRFKVRAVGDGRVTLKGPMMRGVSVNLGPSACLEIDGIRIVVTNADDNTISVLRGIGDGTFQTQEVHATGLGPSALLIVEIRFEQSLVFQSHGVIKPGNIFACFLNGSLTQNIIERLCRNEGIHEGTIHCLGSFTQGLDRSCASHFCFFDHRNT